MARKRIFERILVHIPKFLIKWPSKIMTSKRVALRRLLLVVATLFVFPTLSQAQLVLGQYEYEAPLRTWNIFGLETAPALGRGDTLFAIASDCSVALTNPALLLNLPRISAMLNMSSSYASLYKYSIINTGVLASRGTPSLMLYALDFGGISYQFRGWALALTMALTEIYDRPSARVESFYNGVAYYTLDFSQRGILRNTNFSVAHRLSRPFQIGLAINFVKGNLDREIVEKYLDPSLTISDNKSQDFSGFYMNGGILAKITEKWSAGLVFRTPYTRKSQSKSKLEYLAPAGGTDIKIEAESSDSYKEPLVIGVGISYKFSPGFQVVLDVSYFNWSRYRVVYFGETMERNFKDTFKWGLGAEYRVKLRIFKAESGIPLRVGVVYDKQPMKEPGSAYTYFSAGTGIHWRMIGLDISGSFGRENGSGNSLAARRVALSLSVEL